MTDFLQDVRRGIDGAIAEAVAEAGPSGSEIETIIRGYLARPAGMVRPRLLELTARWYGTGSTTAVTDVSVATELLHLFALLHDDAIDGAAPDRSLGTPDPFLVLAGDLVYAAGYGLLAETVSRFGLDAAIITDVTRIATRTVIGQFEDVRFLASRPRADLNFETLYRLYDAKTGLYTVVAPLIIGARLANVGEAEVSRLREIGLPLGRAYQLRDDRDDLLSLIRRDPTGARTPPWELNLAVTWLAEQAGEEDASLADRSSTTILASLDVSALRKDVAERLAKLAEEADDHAAQLSLAAPRAFVADARAILNLTRK